MIEAALEPENFIPEYELMPLATLEMQVAERGEAIRQLEARLDLLLDALDSRRESELPEIA